MATPEYLMHKLGEAFDKAVQEFGYERMRLMLLNLNRDGAGYA